MRRHDVYLWIWSMCWCSSFALIHIFPSAKYYAQSYIIPIIWSHCPSNFINISKKIMRILKKAQDFFLLLIFIFKRYNAKLEYCLELKRRRKKVSVFRVVGQKCLEYCEYVFVPQTLGKLTRIKWFGWTHRQSLMGHKSIWYAENGKFRTRCCVKSTCVYY